jgi:hypothetical protein
METMKTKEIRTREVFENLFPTNSEVLKKIEEDMRQGKYDLSQPVILATWNGQKEPVCIDGHTRLKAAINAGIDKVPVFTHEFDSEQEAIDKAISLQRNRRNLSDSDILRCITLLDSKKPRGGDRRSKRAKSIPHSDGIENSRSCSAKETAEKIGIGSRKVEKARTVLAKGDPDTVAAVEKGEITLNKAYQEVQKTSGKKPDKETPKPEEKQYAIPDDLYADLDQLGGAIEDHIDVAILAYLMLTEEKRQELMDWAYAENSTTT